jgi:hypothetical protein
MNILSFLNQHKRIIAGIVILIVLIVTAVILLKPNSNQWINCHQNQTLQTCDGKQVCIDNCKDGTKKCNPCDKTCCPNDSSCLGKPPNSVCCSENNICTNSTTTEKQTCCTESQFCDQGACIDCPEGKTLCKNSQCVFTHCCDTDKEECCGDDGVCCPKGNCMKDAQGEKICCDSNDSVVVDGQCCLQSQLYMKEGALACCSNGKVCYDGKKATCCDENEKCSDPGYCVLNTTNPTIINKCIVNAETETQDIKAGQFCVNKYPYQFGNSSFTDCGSSGSSKCVDDEICKTLYYRKKYKCTSSDNCNGLGQSGITSTCYTSKYDATKNTITYTKVTNCDENNKDQVQGGSCGIPCGNGSPGKAPLFCPKTDSCLKIDGKSTSYVCGNTTPKFNSPVQTPSKVQINGEQVNACDQYYPLPKNTKQCILYDNNHQKQMLTEPLVHPNGNSYCPLYTETASALPDPNKNPLTHGPVIITSTGYSGYGGEANFPVVQDKKTGPYNVGGSRVTFGPKDTPLEKLVPIAYSTTKTTSATANAADCYNQFKQLVGVQYITWEPTADANGGTCSAYYNCNNTDFMPRKSAIWNTIQSTGQQIPTSSNEDDWYGTICPDGTNDYIKISDNEGQVGSLATCTASTSEKVKY